MTFEPKALERGWIKRCSVGAVKLAIRSPLLWFVLYICAPVLTYYVPYLPFTTFVAGLILIFGTLLCFANDHLQRYGFSAYLSLLLIKPQPLILILIASFASMFIFTESATLQLESPSAALLRFGLAIMSLYVSVILASLIILIFFDLPMTLFKFYKSRGKADHGSIEPSINGKFAAFALHLCVDTRLSWRDACDMSDKGMAVLKLTQKMILIAPIAFLFVFPLLCGFLIPFFYLLYRELFWQSGLSTKEASLAPAALS
ncbi:MAG: hypothetical protein EOO52_13175 [Gammaproteobacteria bacterium]|nr:MAG: hypothetical protein EOO52_13175 [Gammaproteobacteria bacterium]